MLLVALIVHERLQFTVLMFMIVLGIWGLGNFFRRQPITSSYRGALVIGEGVVLIEALVGLALYLLGYRTPRMEIHILYGITAAIAIPGAFAYTHGRDNRWEGMIYACVCLFLAGLAIRMQQIAAG